MIRVAFIIGEYPPEERRLREDTAKSFSSADVEVGIVSVPPSIGASVRAALSCMSCHTGGVHGKQDEIQAHAAKGALPRDTLDRLAVLYPPYDEDFGYVTLEAFLSKQPCILNRNRDMSGKRLKDVKLLF